MSKRTKTKLFRENINIFLLRIFTVVNGVLPLWVSYAVGAVLGTIASKIVRRHRQYALDSLKIAFPELSLKQRSRIVSQFFRFMAQSAFEVLYYLRNLSKLTNITVHHKKYLDQALAQGNGVILVTAHLGNFPLLSLKLAQQGYPVHIVARPMREQQSGDYLHILRTNAKVKTIFAYPRSACVHGILQALRANEIVIMQMDQNSSTGGVWVKFFGKLAATPIGPVVLALRSKAAVVPAYIKRQSMGKHTIVIEPPVSLQVTKNSDETALLNTITLTNVIEKWVKEVPGQWGWIHRRWKSRPSEKIHQIPYKVQQ